MPITKDVNNVIQYAPKTDLYDSEVTDAFMSSDFSITGDIDPTRQIKFSSNALSPNIAVTVAANASTAANITLTLPSASGTIATTASSGVTAIGTLDSQSKNANAATIVSTTLYMQTADATHPGVVPNIGAANGVASLDSSALIPITQIPPAALERLVIVANQAARFALTTATVQNGDTVKQTDTATMYFVIDDTNLGNAAGYSIYTAGTAASVAWSGITGIPTPVTNLSGTNTGDQTNVSGTAGNVTGTVAIANGGTGQTTKAPAFDALQPMTTGGDVIYGGASGTGTRLANGSSGQVLTSAGGTAAPTWTTPTTGANTSLSNLATTAINQSLLPGTDGVGALGSSSANWSALGVYSINATNGTKAIDLFTTTGRGLVVGATRNVSWGLSSSATAPGVKFDQVTTDGFVKTSSGNGTLTIDATAYLSGTVAIANGGTGQTAKTAAFDALQPMTTGGDIIYGGASGTGTRLANGSAGQILTSAGGTSAPTWSTPSRTINAQTGTTYTFVLADGSGAGSQPLVTLSNAGAITVTVPANGTAAFPVGTQIDCIQQGAGKVSFTPAGGVTINSKASNLSIAAQYVSATLIKTATNTWTLIGDLIA